MSLDDAHLDGSDLLEQADPLQEQGPGVRGDAGPELAPDRCSFGFCTTPATSWVETTAGEPLQTCGLHAERLPGWTATAGMTQPLPPWRGLQGLQR